MPVVSIALPAFNSERTLRAAIASIVTQTHREWELLVMDDGSSDRTVAIAQSFGDERIRVFADGVHRSLPTQLNRAVDMANGKYFARMDADDIAYPSRVQRQLEFLKAHPDIDLAGTWMTVFRSDGTLLGARRPPERHELLCARPWQNIPIAHPTWMGRIEWFRVNRYSDSAVRMEDRELLLRTYRRSRFAVVPEVLLAYREDPRSFRKVFRARRNTCKMAAGFALREKKFLLPGMLIAGQCLRAMMEMVALPAGLDNQLLRRRTSQAREQEFHEFRELWSTVEDMETVQSKAGI